MARRVRDPAAAQISQAANTIMQGLQNYEDVQWQREKRERQRKKWNVGDEASELTQKMFSNLQSPSTSQGLARGEQREMPSGSAPQGGDGTTLAMNEGGGPPQAQPAPQERLGLQQAAQDRAVEQGAQEAAPPGLVGPSRQQQGQAQDQEAPSLEQDLDIEDIERGQLPQWYRASPQELVEDWEQYSPEARRIAQKQFIDWQTDKLRQSSARLKLSKQRAEYDMMQARQKMGQAVTAYKNGDYDTAVKIAQNVYNEHIPNSKVAQVDEQNNVHVKNFVTGESGKAGLNANDPEQLGKTLQTIAGFVSNADKFLQQYALNSEVQLETKAEAIQNAKPLVGPNNNDVVYQVSMPNTETGKIDTLYFENPPGSLRDNPIEDEQRLKEIQQAYETPEVRGGEQGPTVEIGGQKIPWDDLTTEQKNQLTGTTSGEEGRIMIPNVGTMDRSEARQSFKTLLGTLQKADDQGSADLYRSAMTGDLTQQEKELVTERIKRLSKDKEADEITRASASRALNFMKGLYNIGSKNKRQPKQKQRPRARSGQQRSAPAVNRKARGKESGRLIYVLEDGRQVYADEYHRQFGKP